MIIYLQTNLSRMATNKIKKLKYPRQYYFFPLIIKQTFSYVLSVYKSNYF